MASHDSCDHPTTPAARAACRKAGGPSGGVVRPGLPPRKHRGRHHPECTSPTGHDTLGCPVPPGTPAIVKPPARRNRSSATVALKRPNERLRTIGDLTDVPPALAVVIRKAWTMDGWETRVGTPYVHDERRVEVTTPHGTLSLVWRSDKLPLHAVWWRPADTSVQHKIDTVNGALRLANGEDE